MKCYDRTKQKSNWEKLPKSERNEISKYLFISAQKTIIAMILFRCEKFKNYTKEQLLEVYNDMKAIYTMDIFGKKIDDRELIEHYEKMLNVEFNEFDDLIKVE